MDAMSISELLCIVDLELKDKYGITYKRVFCTFSKNELGLYTTKTQCSIPAIYLLHVFMTNFGLSCLSFMN